MLPVFSSGYYAHISHKSPLTILRSQSKLPQIEGIDRYQGKIMHSATWDNSYDLKGKRVAVIGGGSSAVQIVPSIQPSKSNSSSLHFVVEAES